MLSSSGNNWFVLVVGSIRMFFGQHSCPCAEKLCSAFLDPAMGPTAMLVKQLRTVGSVLVYPFMVFF